MLDQHGHQSSSVRFQFWTSSAFRWVRDREAVTPASPDRDASIWVQLKVIWDERKGALVKRKKNLVGSFFYLNKKLCFSCNFCALEWVNEQNPPLLPGSIAIPSIASLLLRHLHSAPLFCCPPFNFISFFLLSSEEDILRCIEERYSDLHWL